MKYEIEGIKKEETIKEYRILNNSIIVTYLDGNLKTFPYTKANEDAIVSEMLKQASYRESKLYSAYMSNKMGQARANTDYIATLVALVTTSSVAANFLLAQTSYLSPAMQAVLLGSSTIGEVLALRTYISVSKKQKKIAEELDDVEKYHIYLKIRDVLKNLPEPELYELYNEVKRKASTLNINTIDEFSLKDLKKISENLKLISASKLEYQPENLTIEPESYDIYTKSSPEEHVGRFSKARNMR